MSFLKKNISFSRFVLMFIFLSLGTFLFTFQQITIAAQTKVVCEGLSLGSSCKPVTPGCDDLGESATEQNKGYCSDVGTGTSHACCVKIPILIANQTACEAISGASCPPAGMTDANCLRAPFSPANKADLLGYCDGVTMQRSCCKSKVTSTGPGTDDYCVNTLHGECKIGPNSCIAPITELGNCTTLQSVARKCCTKAVATTPCASIAPLAPAGCCGGVPGAPACTGTPVSGASASIPFPNPLKFTTVEGVLGGLLGALQSIIVVLSLVFIVIGAVLYITSAGDDGRMKTAKGAITASMIGLAIGIAAPSFLKQIGTILDWNTPAIVCPSTLSAADLASCQAALATYNSGKTLTEIALSVLQFLLSIIGVLGIIMLVIGGIMYLTAAGDEHRIDSGKGIVKYAIIGIAVALAALVIVTQIAGLIA